MTHVRRTLTADVTGNLYLSNRDVSVWTAIGCDVI